ncbi:MAG TPA: ABC transporter permease [Burkholderiales bacterium]|nr:ABC transporter permease [Burkholderiales bacterium]
MNLYLPRLSLRFIPIWRRNALVWRKLAIPSVLGNLADPMIYMLGLGFGLGAFLPEVKGVPYIAFLAAGTVCFSVANTATFEALYSAFSRMHVQRTWDAILNAPISLEDVVIGELVWATTKSFLSGFAIMLVVWALGLSHSLMSLWILALIPLLGFVFAALALTMTALAPSYDFFMYYFTLFITPMAMLCGVFYPIDSLPQTVQWAVHLLPLTHATQLVRPLLFGEMPQNILLHLAALLVYAVVGVYVALLLFKRRLLK